MLMTAFKKLEKHAKMKKHYSELLQKAKAYYRREKLLSRPFNALKSKWSRSKLLDSRYALCKEKVAAIVLRNTLNTLRSKTQAKRMIEAAEVYHKRQQYMRFRAQLEI